MRTLTIAVIPGDGVGLEVVPQAKRVLEKAGQKHQLRFAFEDFEWGASHYFRWGKMMPAGALDLLQPCDAILLGAVGHPDIPDHTTLNGLLLPIRRAFDQYANVRPAYLYPGVKSPLVGREGGQIDMVIVRENTEGEYAQAGGFVYMAQPEEVAVQTAIFTRRGVERIVRYAFELAVKRNGKMRVTSITKSNAQGFSMTLWDRTFQDVAREFPAIETESLLVDAAAMNFIRRPDSFDVVVASNSVRRYSERSGRHYRGQHGPRGQRESGSPAAVPFDVRTGTRIGAGYRGARDRKSASDDYQRSDDAGAFGTGRCGAGYSEGGGGGAGGRQSADAGPGRDKQHTGGDRCDFGKDGLVSVW